MGKSKDIFLDYSICRILGLCVIFFLTSCQYFETTKVDSEAFYNQEIETISWDEVDQYPLFAACDESAEKEVQRNCFKKELSRIILEHLANQKISSANTLNDRFELELFVSEKGKIELKTMAVDSVLQSKLPSLITELPEAIKQAPQVAPALKRGIPVKTALTLPVVLKSKQ